MFFFISLVSACIDIGFSNNCSMHGICAFDQRLNATRCICDTGFYGEFCFNSSSTTTVMLFTTETATSTKIISTIVPSTTTEVGTTVLTTAQKIPITEKKATTNGKPKKTACVDQSMSKIPCNGHGECKHYEEIIDSTSEYYCYCMEQFYGDYCQNEYKSKWVAFFLEFFVGWVGASRFYLGYNAAGVVKLLFGLLGCCGGSILFGRRKNIEIKDCCVAMLVVAMIIMFFVSVIWWLADWISILAGTMTDVSGHKLY